MPASVPGVRPSPLDSRPTTSTGTSSLDELLAGHSGLALGSSLLIEETGTTDIGNTLLRYYAAEGVVQGHRVHTVGVPEQWGRELPGLVGSTREIDDNRPLSGSDRMKIAYRYERLGQFGSGASRSGSSPEVMSASSTFSHSFDLTKRLLAPTNVHVIPIRPVPPGTSPLQPVFQSITHELESTPSITTHRIVIPSLLSPAFYPTEATHPRHILQFLHSLRALLRRYSNTLTAMLSLPLALYERGAGLTRWMELLCDGVIELIPFPHGLDPGPSSATLGAVTAHEEKPQGIIKPHRLPVFHERGGGGVRFVGVDDDLAFTLSRRRFRIQPFRLPPVEADADSSRVDETDIGAKTNLEF